MVQYIFTPWRNRRELLAVRRQFYPDRHPQQQPSRRQTPGQAQSSSTNTAATAYSTYRATTVNSLPPPSSSLSLTTAKEQAVERSHGEKQEAVARVSMWMQRGGCPHMVESTALLTAAILSDEVNGGPGAGSDDGLARAARASRAYAVRAAYSAAFSRFVTGLLDSHQDRQRKMSMYDVAKSVGLPATFVELRHQATHEQLPSLARLRAAADKALDWIWEYYWRGLTAGDSDSDEHESDADEDEADPSGREESGGEAMEGVLGDGDGDGDGENDSPDVTMREEDGGGSGDGGGGVGDGHKPAQEKEIRTLLEGYLEGNERQPQEEEEKEEKLKRELGRFDEGLVLMVLDSISDNTRDSKVLRRALVLGRRILEWKENQEQVSGADRMEEDGPAGDDSPRTGMDTTEKKATEEGEEEDDKEEVEDEEEDEEENEEEPVEDDRPAWVLYDAETWVPKPIGVV
ncbi:hypothetical protein VTG60DRAFT_902 [Thermothelomyces hinnuleus]